MNEIRYALISGGRVTNVVMIDPDDQDQIERIMESCDAMVPTDASGPGWGWTPGGGFTAPPESVPLNPADVVLSRADFLRRFTLMERIAIRSARAADPVIDDLLAMLESTDTVRLAHQDILSGLAHLQQHGYLTPERAAEIAPVQ